VGPCTIKRVLPSYRFDLDGAFEAMKPGSAVSEHFATKIDVFPRSARHSDFQMLSPSRQNAGTGVVCPFG
jgi:hypothetical protein